MTLSVFARKLHKFLSCTLWGLLGNIAGYSNVFCFFFCIIYSHCFIHNFTCNDVKMSSLQIRLWLNERSLFQKPLPRVLDSDSKDGAPYISALCNIMWIIFVKLLVQKRFEFTWNMNMWWKESILVYESCTLCKPSESNVKPERF